MPSIHPTAIIHDPAACSFAPDVQIGPWCVISGKVSLAQGVRLLGNNYLQGPLSIGAGTILYPFACLGYEPQDYKFKPGARTAGVVIGAECLIREHVTVHASTNDHTPTRVGDRVFLMVNSHVAHDARVGNNVVMVNGAGLAGHAQVDDHVTFGGNALVHQFCRIGRLVMMSGDCAVSLDVPPFCMVNERNRLGGINLVGLRRAGFDRSHITQIRRAFRDLLRTPMPRDGVVAELRRRAESSACPPIAELAEFIAASKRGICPGMGKPPRNALKHADRDSSADDAADPAPHDDDSEL